MIQFLVDYRFPIHLILHFLLPFILAKIVVKDWFIPFLLMFSTMLIDLDHLLATPILDPNRCSLVAHLFHKWYFYPFYLGLLYNKKTKWIGAGLVIHIALDGIDCILMKI